MVGWRAERYSMHCKTPTFIAVRNTLVRTLAVYYILSRLPHCTTRNISERMQSAGYNCSSIPQKINYQCLREESALNTPVASMHAWIYLFAPGDEWFHFCHPSLIPHLEGSPFSFVGTLPDDDDIGLRRRQLRPLPSIR